jgi:DNA-binding transcriptional regulator LsrR (DeoR family)
MGLTDRPAQLILIASVARRYYLEGRSKVEIAEELGLSRFKVARLLDTARARVKSLECSSMPTDTPPSPI